jgi:2-methylisocitrate lyase-like PEP mutase family enzyme
MTPLLPSRPISSSGPDRDWSRASRFRGLLAENEIVLAPLIYDGITARMAERHGYEAAWLGGGSALGCNLGLCDSGLYTLTELVRQTRIVTRTTELSPIVGIDSGFGSVANVWRAVRELERAGAAGVSINDQPFPQHYPGRPGWGVLPLADAVNRVKAAMAARRDTDFLIIARTDALDIDEAIERGNAFAAAGADMARIVAQELAETEEEIRRISERSIRELAVPTNITVHKKINYSVTEAQQLGYRIMSFRVTPWSIAAIRDVAANLSHGTNIDRVHPLERDAMMALLW